MPPTDPRAPLLTSAQVGRAIRILRERRGLNQTKLAADAHVDRPAVGKIERGEQFGAFETFDKLLSGMGATWIEFGEELERVRKAS